MRELVVSQAGPNLCWTRFASDNMLHSVGRDNLMTVICKSIRLSEGGEGFITTLKSPAGHDITVLIHYSSKNSYSP